MRIVRFSAAPNEAARWGVLEGSDVFVTEGPGGTRSGEHLPLAAVRLLAPARPTKIVCVGRNYFGHIREMGNDSEPLPEEPGLFLKGPNTLADPFSDIPYPHFTSEFHYEGELAVVIGKRILPGTPRPMDHVLGYTAGIDLTARDRQRSDLQWARAKSADAFCPLGPWVETDIEPGRTVVRTFVNGVRRQEGRTDDMIFPVSVILGHITTFMTLEEGDVVLTGTPEGVGEIFPGDRVEVTVDGLGAPLVMTVSGEEA
ncbi:MAG: fumarylacetoacetate hydrolase family protein [Thermovirgaceae bacterium]|nr:fumarylacetoacetate hydrolase family protein [Thermovirgaceae bacterium]